MSKTEPDCPSCKERMVEGYLLDLAHGHQRHPAQWVEGAPKKSFWMGLDIKGRAQRTVVAFRCPRCGLLREYAL
jgi:hypothetical protein